MGCGIDLRKRSGLGGAGGVAAGAEDGGVEFRWGDVGGIGSVFGERTVAGFAVDAGVLALALRFLNVGVAVAAGLVAGEDDGTGGDLIDGGGAIVTVLTEAFGNDKAANDEKDEKSDDEESQKAKEMTSIFEEVHAALSP